MTTSALLLLDADGVGAFGLQLVGTATPEEANTLLGDGGAPINWLDVHGIGLLENRPAAIPDNAGWLYYATDAETLTRSNGTDWQNYVPPPGTGGGGGWNPNDPLVLPAGSLTALPLTIGAAGNGIYANGTSLVVVTGGAARLIINSGGVLLQSGNCDITAARNIAQSGKHILTGASGANSSADRNTALFSVSTSALFTDTLADLLPSGSYIESVVGRVTQTVGGATTMSVGDASDPDRFGTTSSLATGNTFRFVDFQGRGQDDPDKIRFSFDQVPTSGQIRVVVFFKQYTAPVS